MNRLLSLLLLAAMLPATSQARPVLSAAEGLFQDAPSRPGERRGFRDSDRRAPRPRGQLDRRGAPLPPPWLLQQMMDVPADQQQQALESNPLFRELSPDSQERMRNSLRRFQELPPDRREELLGRIRRFQQMPPARQQELIERQRRFRELPPDERQRIEQRFDAFRRLSPEQRERAREIYSSRWRSLSPDRRRALMDEFRRLRALPPDERARRLAQPDVAGRFNSEERELLRELSTL